MEKEQWKEVTDYEGLYRVSDLGRIYSVRYKKIMSTKVSKGYSRVIFYKNKSKKSFLTHRVVMTTFVGKSDLQVDHINGIKTDNRLDNLRYVEPRENIKFYYEGIPTKVDKVGVRKIKGGNYTSRIWLDGSRYTIGTYTSEREAAEKYDEALMNHCIFGIYPEDKIYESVYTGVRKTRSRYSAKITINKNKYHLGVHDKEEDASEAYQEALKNWEQRGELPNYINYNKASKYEGIYFAKGTKKPWKASIKVQDKRKHIGYFYTEEEAYEAQLKYKS